jgi:hypothetical protein
MKKAIVFTVLSLLILISVSHVWRVKAQSGPAASPVVWDPAASSVLIRFGVTDTATRVWRGSVEPAGGDAQVLALTGYHFQDDDALPLSDGGVRGFSFTSRAWTPSTQQVDLSPILPGPRAVFPNGVYVTVKGGAAARFHVVGIGPSDFFFTLGDLAGRKQLTFDKGNIEVEQAAVPFSLSSTGEADFPALAAGAGGRLAVAWQEFVTDHDRLVTREWDGTKWGAAEALESPETRDAFWPAAAYDGDGTLHVVWSAQVDGNFDLYERRKPAGQGWSAVERLTTAPGSDLRQKIAAGANGDVWLTWQAFRSGQSDIFLKHFTGGKWGEEVRVSESAANDWEPSLAVAPNGTVWVGWDTYDKGNYDVLVRSYTGNKLGPLRPVTTSPRFEAHASLACDPQGRLWIAYDEADANWGKDYGYLKKTGGNPLYQSRAVKVVRLTEGRLEEPVADLKAAFPLYLPRFLQNPQISVLSDGTVAIAALELTKSNSVIEVWGANGVWENVVFTLDQQGWRLRQDLPLSAGANDQRVALTAAAGTLWAAWAADQRDFTSARPRQQLVYAAAVPLAGGAGEIQMKPFQERPDLEFATHPDEPEQLKTIRSYRIDTVGASLKIMRGDLHRHTSLSADGVGDGSLWDFYRYALDAANLDFSTVTDHQGGATSYNWWKTQKSSDLFQVPGRLQTLYAYERSVVYPNGHRNMVFTHRGVPILPIDPAEQTGPDTPGTMRSSQAVLPYLRKYDGIAFRHTTATDQGTDWADHNNELEPMVEIYQGHRLAYEHEGAPKTATAGKLYTQRSGYRPAGFFWNALAKGYRMGIEASSDHCSTHISYSCILVSGDSKQDLVDAMRKRHTYGATDNIVCDFRARAGSREYLQGDDFSTSEPYALTVNVIGTGSIKRIDVIHNESYAYTVTPSSKTARFSYSDAHPANGENRYYVRVEQEDGNLAWSSPIWVTRK